MRGIKIIGTGVYNPDVIVTNDDLSKIMETDNEWIVSRTGIRSRNFSKNKSNHYMASEAAKNAIKSAGISPEDIDLIIASSCSPEYFYPNLASLVQLGTGCTNAAVVEINTACTGFISALDIASRYLTDGDYKKVLVVASERLSSHVDFRDRSSCILFGDGAGAAVIEHSEKPLYSYLSGKADNFEALYCHINKESNCPYVERQDETTSTEAFNGENKMEYLQMDGKAVYKFAVDAMATAVEKTLAKAGLTKDDIDLVIPHQANIRIIQSATKALGIPSEKVFVNIGTHANTSSACIPICLEDLRKEGRIKEGMKICLVGFGAGLTSGAIIFEQ